VSVSVWRVDVLRMATRPTMVRHMQRSPFCLQVAGQDAELPIVNLVMGYRCLMVCRVFVLYVSCVGIKSCF
jgi:hypothetical protein